MVSHTIALDTFTIARGAEIVRKGGLIVYPSDTVYGLGCDPFNEDSVRRLFEAKGRGSKAIPLLCSSQSNAEMLVDLPPRAKHLALANWPGALTIVAPLKKVVPPQLTQGSKSLGVRVPADQSCLELIRKCGGWLTGTSANISGRPSCRTADEALRQLGPKVDMILDGGVRAGKESTVIQVVGDSVTILRTGPVGVGPG